MLALVSFLIVVLFSIIVIRIGKIALESTGLSEDISAFQAQSAFSGVGFTTAESEVIMSHPSRRRILRFLMLMGSAGLTSAIATLVLTFTDSSRTVVLFNLSIDRTVFNLVILLGGLVAILLISATRFFDSTVKWGLERIMEMVGKRVELYDYEKILGLSKGYTIGSFEVPKRHWMVNKTIRDLELEKEGVIVLGVYRFIHGHEEYLGVPSTDFKIHHGDKIMVFCKESMLASLAKRPKGTTGNKQRRAAEQVKRKMDIIEQIDEQKLTTAAKHRAAKKEKQKKRTNKGKRKKKH